MPTEPAIRVPLVNSSKIKALGSITPSTCADDRGCNLLHKQCPLGQEPGAGTGAGSAKTVGRPGAGIAACSTGTTVCAVKLTQSGFN